MTEIDRSDLLSRWQQVSTLRRGDTAILSETGEVQRTFQGIEEEAKRWADRLEGKPQTIAIQIGNAPEWPALLLAAWRTGKTVVPFDPDLSGERRANFERLCGVGLRIERREGMLACVELENQDRRTGADFYKLTSGTTSEPRAIRFTMAQLLADCDSVCDSMGIRGNDINYGVISLAHSYGFSNLVTPLLCRGVTLAVAGDMIPRAILNGLRATKASVFPGVPALFRTLSSFAKPEGPLRLCLSAGAPLDASVARAFQAGWNRKVHSFYGASECGAICYDASDELEVPAGYVGAAASGVSLTFTDSGFPSLVQVRSAAVGSGYDPESLEDSLRDGCFQPSDLLAPAGGGFVIAGRTSDFINVAGRKVNPLEIEQAMAGLPGLREIVVLGVDATSRGEDVVACVSGDIGEAALKAACATRLPAWQIPKRWIFWEEIPRNARGKISRADLRQKLA